MVKKSDNEKKILSLVEDLDLLEGYSQELFSFAPIPLFFVSPVGVILEANPMLEDMTKKNTYELIGEGIETIFSGKKIKDILEETLKSGIVRDEEIFILDKEKKKIPVSIFSQIRKNKKGSNIGCFFGLIDLTEIKKKEEALKESGQVLEIKVAAETRELQNLTNTLETNIKKRTKELEEKLSELERINKLMVGRELKMIELKEKIKKAGKEIARLKNNSI